MMDVKLIRWTLCPDEMVSLGARLCYSQMDMDRMQDLVAENDQSLYVQKVMERGHLSVTEHAVFTFAVEGVSRTLLAQLTRHRIASFSVQSQRYVSMEKGFEYVIPPSIKALGAEEEAEYIREMEQMHAWYCRWQEKLGKKGEESNEDARFVLPNAAATRLLVTMNARELMHFFELRCCRRAQWEIREMAWKMLKACKDVAPAIFRYAGPLCLYKRCAEGGYSCGKPYTEAEMDAKT